MNHRRMIDRETVVSRSIVHIRRVFEQQVRSAKMMVKKMKMKMKTNEAAIKKESCKMKNKILVALKYCNCMTRTFLKIIAMICQIATMVSYYVE